MLQQKFLRAWFMLAFGVGAAVLAASADKWGEAALCFGAGIVAAVVFVAFTPRHVHVVSADETEDLSV